MFTLQCGLKTHGTQPSLTCGVSTENVPVTQKERDRVKLINHSRANLCGIVSRNISSMQLHVSLHVFTLNFIPLDITRFSRQFVPDLASCSLSACHRPLHGSVTTPPGTRQCGHVLLSINKAELYAARKKLAKNNYDKGSHTCDTGCNCNDYYSGSKNMGCPDKWYTSKSYIMYQLRWVSCQHHYKSQKMWYVPPPYHFLNLHNHTA